MKLKLAFLIFIISSLIGCSSLRPLSNFEIIKVQESFVSVDWDLIDQIYGFRHTQNRIFEQLGVWAFIDFFNEDKAKKIGPLIDPLWYKLSKAETFIYEGKALEAKKLVEEVVIALRQAIELLEKWNTELEEKGKQKI